MIVCHIRKPYPGLTAALVLLALLLHPLIRTAPAEAATNPAAITNETTEEKPKTAAVAPSGPVDELNRGTPRGAFKGFIVATRDGKFDVAANYLDLRNLPRNMTPEQGPELARRLKISLDRALWVDVEIISDDPKGAPEEGLPPYRDLLGKIKTPERTVDILLQRVPREDGVQIWKFSNRTVAQIPHLFEHFGYRPFEQKLSQWMPDFTFLGWQSWQWVFFLICVGLAYLAAVILSGIAGVVLRKKESEIWVEAALLVTGPIRFLLWLLLTDLAIHYIGPSATIRSVMQGGTLVILAFTWAIIRGVGLGFSWWAERLRKSGQESATLLLRPIRNIIMALFVVAAVLLWLDNVGFNVTTLLTGLGVGGLAVALAAQDTLKNFIGSIMILLDKPYQVGQRIVIKGHDGIVEDIGLRSTKLRLLTGHQTTVPNEEMARLDIENIGRRPHIRRLVNIGITYDTPAGKVQKAVEIILKILENHEGMDPALPPRVYFNDFNAYSLNLLVLYWYHPADYWGYMAHGQQVNLQIMREFKKEGIRFALPTQTSQLAQDKDLPLQIQLSKEVGLADNQLPA